MTVSVNHFISINGYRVDHVFLKLFDAQWTIMSHQPSISKSVCMCVCEGLSVQVMGCVADGRTESVRLCVF